jgi:hypothetical protein
MSTVKHIVVGERFETPSFEGEIGSSGGHERGSPITVIPGIDENKYTGELSCWYIVEGKKEVCISTYFSYML